jgi:hypothetical protein
MDIDQLTALLTDLAAAKLKVAEAAATLAPVRAQYTEAINTLITEACAYRDAFDAWIRDVLPELPSCAALAFDKNGEIITALIQMFQQLLPMLLQLLPLFVKTTPPAKA